MFFPVYPWMYALVFITLLLTWPLYVVSNFGILLLCLVINTSIFLTVVWFINSPELSFWRGLSLLCESYSTGCANITMLYIIPLLLAYYVLMIIATCKGFWQGKNYTKNWWIKTIYKRFPINARGDDLRLDLALDFYEVIFGCNKTIRVEHLEARPNGDVISAIKTLTVTVPAGVDSGTRLRIPGEGDASQYGGSPGDLYIYLLVPLESGEFKRDGTNVISEIRITTEEAERGGEVTVNTIDGEAKLMIPPGTNSGDYLTLKGHGVPKLGSPTDRGDHIIQVVF